MKKLKKIASGIGIACALCLAPAAAKAAVQSVNVEVSWQYSYYDPADPNSWPAAFYLYSSPNPQGPYTIVTNVPGVVGGKLSTNVVVPSIVAKRFFYVTSSNAWYGIESFPSAATNSPAAGPPDNIAIARKP